MHYRLPRRVKAEICLVHQLLVESCSCVSWDGEFVCWTFKKLIKNLFFVVIVNADCFPLNRVSPNTVIIFFDLLELLPNWTSSFLRTCPSWWLSRLILLSLRHLHQLELKFCRHVDCVYCRDSFSALKFCIIQKNALLSIIYLILRSITTLLVINMI